MKKILLASITAAFLCSSAFAGGNISDQKKQSMFNAEAKNKNGGKGISVTSDVYFEDHETDHFRQKKYALADGKYTLQPLNKKLELYVEGKAGIQSEEYRFENAYATTIDQKADLYLAAEVGAKYHLLDNVAVGTEFTMLDTEAQKIRRHKLRSQKKRVLSQRGRRNKDKDKRKI